MGITGTKEGIRDRYTPDGVYKKIIPIIKIKEKYGPRFEYPIHLEELKEAIDYISKYLKINNNAKNNTKAEKALNHLEKILANKFSSDENIKFLRNFVKNKNKNKE